MKHAYILLTLASVLLIATDQPRSATADVPASRAVPPTRIGVNVAGSVYFGTERTFANLAYAASPWLDPDASWGAMAAGKLNAAGYPRVSGVLPLNVPQPVWSNRAVPITCTWKGKASIRVDGDAGGFGRSGKVSFTWRGFDVAKLDTRPSLMLYVTDASDSAPMSDLDCREAGLETVGEFDKRVVDDLKPFKLLRFLDWSAANANPPSVTWAARSTTARNGVDGMALEHQIDLANATGADAWFTIPWNADADYIRHHAELVRDRLGAGQKAYYELSNEVWNFQFGQTTQALNEGLAQNLSSDKYTNQLYRLGQKSTEMMKVVTPIFAAQPGRLVRVIGSMNANPWAGEQVLSFKDTAKWHDAFATAPYFGHSFFDAPFDKTTVADIDSAFVRLEAQRAETIGFAVANKATATKYGLRYISYEAGQHIVAANGKDAPLARAMQRDPRMGAIYARFLSDWKTKIGDTLTLYAATGQISQYGSWGMREYAGQPLAETPKRRAVLEAIGGR